MPYNNLIASLLHPTSHPGSETKIVSSPGWEISRHAELIYDLINRQFLFISASQTGEDLLFAPRHSWESQIVWEWQSVKY